MSSGRAFIGVSLDSKSFSREWVRSALPWILARHEELLIVIADELLFYTRTTCWDGDCALLNFDDAKKRAELRCREVEIFFRSEIERLSPEDVDRVQVARWSAFSDVHYSRISRMVRIAFESIADFSGLVCDLATVHAKKISLNGDCSSMVRLCSNFILDETAMCLRITELAGFSFEYYPGDDIAVLGELCAGRWSQCGLSVEAILGVGSKRKFTRLLF